MNIQDRIVTLLSEIGQGLYEKEAELRLGLLAALAGESIILLGPPGVAKSRVARRLTCCGVSTSASHWAAQHNARNCSIIAAKAPGSTVLR